MIFKKKKAADLNHFLNKLKNKKCVKILSKIFIFWILQYLIIIATWHSWPQFTPQTLFFTYTNFI